MEVIMKGKVDSEAATEVAMVVLETQTSLRSECAPINTTGIAETHV